jgi:serine/threonine protein kinase
LYSVHLSPAQHHRHHALPPIPERTLWSYVVQLCNVLKLVHSNGLAARTLESTKILVTGKDRLRVNCCSILDVIRYEQPLTPDALRNLQQEDLFDLGKVVLSLACQSAGAIHNLQKSIEYLARVYSPDLQQLCLYLFSKPHPRKTIDEILNTLVGSWRLLEELNASLGQSDILESEMLREVENARLVRLLCKFGFINERPECAPVRLTMALIPAADSTTIPDGPTRATATWSSSSATMSFTKSAPRTASRCWTSATSCRS